MNYLHKKKVFNCNLKTSNVMIHDDNTIKLCDFGKTYQYPPNKLNLII